MKRPWLKEGPLPLPQSLEHNSSSLAARSTKLPRLEHNEVDVVLKHATGNVECCSKDSKVSMDFGMANGKEFVEANVTTQSGIKLKSRDQDGLHAAICEQIFGSSNLFEGSDSEGSLPEHISRSPATVSPGIDRDSAFTVLLAACSQGDEAQRMEALLNVARMLEQKDLAINLTQMEDLCTNFIERFWNEKVPSLQSCIVRLLTLLAGLAISRDDSDAVELDGGGELREVIHMGETEKSKEGADCALLIFRNLVRILDVEGQNMGETSYIEENSAGKEPFEVPEFFELHGNAEVICQILWSIRNIIQLEIHADLPMLRPVMNLLDCKIFSVRHLSIQLLEVAICQECGRKGGRLTYLPQAEFLAEKLHYFFEDPSPIVKIAAIDAVRNLCSSGANYNQKYYKCAAAVLGDSFAGVRMAALKLVAAWARFAAHDGETYSSDAEEAFLHVCSMATDMDMAVRSITFMELGEMPVEKLSEALIVQTLSKRIAKGSPALGNSPTSSFLLQDAAKAASTEDIEGKKLLLGSFAAGAFVHGLEDEFWEVRTEALTSLCRYCVVVTDGASALIVDCINDDNGSVRRKALEVLIIAATEKRLVLKDDQLQTVRAVLDDVSREMRRLCRLLLGTLGVVKRTALQSIVQALVGSLKSHRNDEEAEVLEALAAIGRIHGTLVHLAGSEFVQQAMSLVRGEGGVSDPLYKGLIVLLASASRFNGGLNTILPAFIWDHLSLLKHKLPAELRSFVDSKTFWNQTCKQPRMERYGESERGGSFSLAVNPNSVHGLANFDRRNDGVTKKALMERGASHLRSGVAATSSDFTRVTSKVGRKRCKE